MRRAIAVLALPAALAVSLALCTSVAAAGDGAQKVQWNGFVPDYQGNGLAVPVSCTTLVTPGGIANQSCHGDGAANPTGSTVHLSGESTGFYCFPMHPIVPYPSGTPSQNWTEVITPSGQVSWDCKLP